MPGDFRGISGADSFIFHRLNVPERCHEGEFSSAAKSGGKPCRNATASLFANANIRRVLPNRDSSCFASSHEEREAMSWCQYPAFCDGIGIGNLYGAGVESLDSPRPSPPDPFRNESRSARTPRKGSKKPLHQTRRKELTPSLRKRQRTEVKVASAGKLRCRIWPRSRGSASRPPLRE